MMTAAAPPNPATLAEAEALGRAGHPRLRAHRDLRAAHGLPVAGRLGRRAAGRARPAALAPGRRDGDGRPDPRDRPRRRRRSARRRHGGRDRDERQQRHEGLLRRPRGHRGGLPRAASSTRATSACGTRTATSSCATAPRTSSSRGARTSRRSRWSRRSAATRRCWRCAVIGVPRRPLGRAAEGLRRAAPRRRGRRRRSWPRTSASGSPRFKCPDVFEFLAELPRTSTGKVRKFELREREWAGRERRIN